MAQVKDHTTDRPTNRPTNHTHLVVVGFPERFLESPKHVHDGKLEFRVPEEARGVEHAGALDRRSGVPLSKKRRPIEGEGICDLLFLIRPV